MTKKKLKLGKLKKVFKKKIESKFKPLNFSMETFSKVHLLAFTALVVIIIVKNYNSQSYVTFAT